MTHYVAAASSKERLTSTQYLNAPLTVFLSVENLSSKSSPRDAAGPVGTGAPLGQQHTNLPLSVSISTAVGVFSELPRIPSPGP